jgi:hypothetical protein
MNHHRAINPIVAQAVTEAEIGIDEPFRISDEIKRSAEAVKATGTLDRRPAHARSR